MQKIVLLSVFFVALYANISFAQEAAIADVTAVDDLSVSISNPETEEYIIQPVAIVPASEDSSYKALIQEPVIAEIKSHDGVVAQEIVADSSSDEGDFLAKLKTCEHYVSKETRPFDPTMPATQIVGWENEKCRLNTISIIGTPVKCNFSKDKLSEIVRAYSDILNSQTVDINNNAIIKALSDENICNQDYPEGDAYYSEVVLTQMANKIAKCERIEIDNINPLTATLTKRIIKGFEAEKCVYVETFPGNLNMVCKYPITSLQELSSAYSEQVLELNETGKISADSNNPNIIDRLNNDLTVCKIESVEPAEEEE